MKWVTRSLAAICGPVILAGWVLWFADVAWFGLHWGLIVVAVIQLWLTGSYDTAPYSDDTRRGKVL